MNCQHCGTEGRTGPYFNCGTEIRDDGAQSNACRGIARLNQRVRVLEEASRDALVAIRDMSSRFGVTKGLMDSAVHLRQALAGGEGEKKNA